MVVSPSVTSALPQAVILTVTVVVSAVLPVVETEPIHRPLEAQVQVPAPPSSNGGPVQSLADAVSDAERRAITSALEQSPHDLSRVAEVLGVSATTLWRKMKRLGLKTTGEEPQLS